ncbi:hypothetical protein TWF730_005491 [Orbilia blumenaviensis]|uniref:Uncharacterized protein n=1 Tax=Orbilia blumenaviensis TaxID=1796055 RepID=A0AAV9VPP5_9PEZI
MVEGAPGKHHKRKPYDINDPGTSSSQVPITPVGYGYGYTSSVDLAPQPTSKAWSSYASAVVPPCPDWVLCRTCTGGYYCPSTDVIASPTESLVVVPTCASWKECPECRGGYKCWKSKSTPAEAAPTSLTIVPTCYPWNYCDNCVGGYSCPSDQVLTTAPITGQ